MRQYLDIKPGHYQSRNNLQSKYISEIQFFDGNGTQKNYTTVKDTQTIKDQTTTHLSMYFVDLISKRCKHDLATFVWPLSTEWKWDCLQLPILKVHKKLIHRDKNSISTDWFIYLK